MEQHRDTSTMSEDELRQYAQELQQRLTEASKPKTKVKPDIDFRVTYEGEVQIRHIGPQYVNLPADVLKTLFKKAGKVIDFISQHESLLTLTTDDESVQQQKQTARDANLETENPIVRKPSPRRLFI